MNMKIVRNFSMMALMLGAMFVLTSRKAQAQNYQCEAQCGQAYGVCEDGCGSAGGPECFDQCQNQWNSCLALCN